MIDIAERFYSKLDKSSGEDECWLWIGTADQHGRGHFWMNGRNHRAPRIAWSLHHGIPFPENLLACHTCDNPRCVNPFHIYAGTMSANIKDAVRRGRHKANAHASGWQRHKTACKRGHPFSPENTFINTYGGRGCRICQRMHDANYRTKRARAALTPRQGGSET